MARPVFAFELTFHYSANYPTQAVTHATGMKLPSCVECYLTINRKVARLILAWGDNFFDPFRALIRMLPLFIPVAPGIWVRLPPKKVAMVPRHRVAWLVENTELNLSWPEQKAARGYVM